MEEKAIVISFWGEEEAFTKRKILIGDIIFTDKNNFKGSVFSEKNTNEEYVLRDGKIDESDVFFTIDYKNGRILKFILPYQGSGGDNFFTPHGGYGEKNSFDMGYAIISLLKKEFRMY